MTSSLDRVRAGVTFAVGLTLALALAAPPAAAGAAYGVQGDQGDQGRKFQVFTDPDDPAYLASTCELDLSGFAEFEPVDELTGCGQHISIDPVLEKRGRAEHWGDPHENLNGKHVKDWEGKHKMTTAGFVIAPDSLKTYQITVTFWDGADVVGSISRKASGDAGEKLFAARSVRPFDSIDIAIEGDVNIAIAEIRVDATETSTGFAGYSADAEAGTSAAVRGTATIGVVPCSTDGPLYTTVYALGTGRRLSAYVTCTAGFEAYRFVMSVGGEIYAPPTRQPAGTEKVAMSITRAGSKVVVRVDNLTTGERWVKRFADDGTSASPVAVGLSNVGEDGTIFELGVFEPVAFDAVKINGKSIKKESPTKITMVDADGAPVAVPGQISPAGSWTVARLR